MIKELEEIARLQEIVKSRSMIYQCTAKEIVASFYNIPLNEVDLPFDQWMSLREKYEQESGKRL